MMILFAAQAGVCAFRRKCAVYAGTVTKRRFGSAAILNGTGAASCSSRIRDFCVYGSRSDKAHDSLKSHGDTASAIRGVGQANQK
jgi:hypothetical protein